MNPQSVDSSFRHEPGASGGTWRRSSFCEVNGSCVEVAQLVTGEVGVRDGKIGPLSPVLSFGQAEWRAFVASVVAGQFDVG